MGSLKRGLLERLALGEDVMIAEGYCLDMERRGYLKAGHYVPEVVHKHPDIVETLHREYVHAGSDVTQAFTYYCNREKIKQLEENIDLETMYIKALRIAKKVADDTGTLLAGDISYTTIYNPTDDKQIQLVKEMFKEQVEWISSVGVDYVVAETFGHLGEARLAMQAIKDYGNGVPAVVTFSPRELSTWDGVPIHEACHQMELEGAAVVGYNCSRGPSTMLPLLPQLRASCKGFLAVVPVPYRTTSTEPIFQSLSRLNAKEMTAFPDDLDEHLCCRSDIDTFTKEAKDIGIQYFGLCCGNMSGHTRRMAEALGKTPPASLYSPDMDTHECSIPGNVAHAKRRLYNYEK